MVQPTFLTIKYKRLYFIDKYCLINIELELYKKKPNTQFGIWL